MTGTIAGMPLPVVLVKVLLAIKILKYPVAAVVDSLREYRRRERARERRVHYVATRHFFHHPIRALGDGRFWRKCLTNSAEIIVHLFSLWALAWNLLRRLTTHGYVSWRPHHTHESELYAVIEHAPWGTVFRRTGEWLINAFRRWPGARTARLELQAAARRGRWVELRFDGGFVMVRGSARTRQPLLRIQRPGSAYWLEIRAAGKAGVGAIVRSEAGGVLGSVHL